MKKYAVVLLLAVSCSFMNAQSYEGTLKLTYKDESGKSNTADILIKGDKYYIKKGMGGNEKYNAYLLDTKAHSLSCMSDHAPKTAVVFNVDKVLSLYEKDKLKPGYKVHESLSYKATSATKTLSEVTAAEKKLVDDTITYDIWTADIKVNFHDLIPVLRIAGFWNRLEDGSNAILEGTAANKRTLKSSTISIIAAKMKVNDKLFEVPKEFQTVDLNKFITEQGTNPKLGDLVKAFAGF